MRKWGVIITAFYALAVVLLLLPGAALLAGAKPSEIGGMYGAWLTWVPVAIVVTGQAMLLFLSVDSAKRRLKPRGHVLVTLWTAAMLFALLTMAGLTALTAGVFGDEGIDHAFFLESAAAMLISYAGLWAFWGLLFHHYLRGSEGWVTRATDWLLRGSVLELLIVVPCHIAARRREECSAPTATAFGIATGIAVMLLSFGPGVLFLYKKRLESYSAHKSAAA